MTEPHRTVAAERDLPRVREWIDQSVRHAVNEAAQWVNTAHYRLDLKEAEITEWMKTHNPECECEVGETWLEAIREFRALLPALPETNRRAESGEEVTGMAGTRVTRDRELPLNGGEDGDRGGSDSGN